MPRNYKRTTTRQSWSEDAMEKAIKELLDGNMGYLKASKTYNVPQSTLEDRVKKARRGLLVEKASKKACMGGFKTVFTPDQERTLANHISIMESRLFNFTVPELRTMAYDLAVKNGIGNKFDSEKKMAGKDWLQGFLKRHKELSIKPREKTSSSSQRAMGLNRMAVTNFYNTLKGLFQKYKFSPIDIYNVAETAITTVPNKPSRMLTIRGSRQIGSSTSQDRKETLVTAEICMSAAGIFMPAMFIFSCEKANPSLLDDALPGSTAEYHETGSIQKDSFVTWFKKFIRFANPSTEKPVLLLLDGQASHTKSMELINLSSENNVILLSFPPDCTHKLQPLDITFMGQLSVFYEQEVEKWLSVHPGCYVTIHEVGKLFGNAFMSSAVMATAINGFRTTGIYPFDPNVLPDHLFAPSDATDGFIPPSDLMENFPDNNDSLWLSGNSAATTTTNITASQPSTSRDSCFDIHSQNMANEPHAQREIREENILICSPYKFELENAIADLTEQQIQVFMRKREFSENSSVNVKKMTKKSDHDSSIEEEKNL